MARTYFVIEDKTFDHISEIKILGYFTLSQKTLNIDKGISKTKIKKLTGFSNPREKNIPVFLIGQLGKNDKFRSKISGDELIEKAHFKIKEGQEKIAGRGILVECKNIPYLRNFYEKHNYIFIDKEYKKGDLLQYLKILNPEDIIEKR
ncbi:hypothetical protein [Geotoga petraea]|uniref:Uncharacterized protein n=1 Tax=Geotoga petraea TaxID=28234 RepID=A0A4Z0W264_9BACT|nr:hypothetical protein [Geotoga petraea]TGG86964.1 hypothetical protein E4650_08890 [Geotoga petraea]